MKKLIKPLWLALATLSALLTVVSCVKDLKPQEQEVNFDLLLTSDQSQINQDQQSVANQITITEEKVDCPRPTKYSVSFTYDETAGSLLFLGEPVQSGKPFALSSLSNLTLTYQAKKLADNKVNIVVANDAPKKLSKELVWSILADEFYRVTVEHEGEGSVTVIGADSLSAVKPDTKLSVTAEPAEGWKLTSLTANDVDILNDKSFVVTANTTVRAVFTTEAPETYAVTLVKEGEGKVDITGADDLSAVVTGTKLTVSAEPASGWRLVSMTANGEDILSSKSFVVKGNTTVKVVFKKQPPKTYAITLEKEGEGKVDITGADDLSAVVTGTKLTVTAIPASGWRLVSMTANGEDILSSKSFVVKSNTTVKVVFKKQPPKTYAVTLVKEGEGKVDITGANDLGAVVTGTKLTVTAVPASGWEISSMIANGVDILSSKSFVVKGNTTVKVVFKKQPPKTYAVTLVKEGEGKVDITGANDLGAVVTGTKLTVPAVPASGWEISSMTANGVDILSSKSFVVKGNTTVKVVFKKQPPKTYSVTLVKEGEGKVDITGANDLGAVVTGTKLTVTAIPANGWEISSMTANGVDILSSKSFVVKGNTTVKVVFKKQPPKTYAVTLVKEGEGKVDITGANDLGAVVTGTKLTVTAVPASGWEISSMTANGVDILSSKSFVVTENTTVEVVFEMTSKDLRIHLVRTDLVSQYLKSPKLANYVFQSDLDLVQKYFPKVVTDKGEELTPYMIKRGKRLNGTTDDVVEWTLLYGSIPIGTKVSFVLDEAAMSPLVATLSKGDYIGGKNYANQSFVIEKTLWKTDEFTLYYSLAEGFAYFAYPSQTQTSSEHGYINVKPPYRPFRVLARYGGEGTDIPPYEIVAVPTQSQVEITPIGLSGWAYNGLRLTELDAKQAPVDTDFPANVLSIPIKNKSSLVTCRWYYKGQ